MAINVLGLGGSPRRGGNSDILLDKALQGALDAGASTEKIVLNELSIRPCQECGGCREGGGCIIKDDMQIIYTKLAQVQGVIVASPIFFSGISAQLKAMIDRIQCHWVAKYQLGQKPSPVSGLRKGVFISVRGQRGLEVFQAASKPVKAFMQTEGFQYVGELYCDGLDYKGAVHKQPRLLAEAYRLGQDLVNKIKEGKT
jgi:multimeric flavodoxin WrbA